MRTTVDTHGNKRLDSDHAIPSVEMDRRVVRTFQKIESEFERYAEVGLNRVIVEKGRSTFYLLIDVRFHGKLQYNKMKLTSPKSLEILNRFKSKFDLIMSEFSILFRDRTIERDRYEIDVRTAYIDYTLRR